MNRSIVIVFAFILGAIFITAGAQAATLGAGWKHSLAVQNNGTVWAWGDNSSGQLGDGTYDDSTTPIPLAGLTDVVAVAGGSRFSLALTRDGTVWGWGSNWHGQLGEKPDRGRPLPLPITGLPPVAAIAAGIGHGLALTSEGEVWSWGRTGARFLADGSWKTEWWHPSPVELPPVRSIAAGGAHSLVLAEDGTVWAWGLNHHGQVGDGSRRYARVPVKVPGLEEIIHLAAGREHSLAVGQDGAVFEWGRSFGGSPWRVGERRNLTPKSVNGLPPVKSVAAGASHSLALAVDGSVWAWGENSRGQLGDGTRRKRRQPAHVDSISDVVFVAAGWYHNLALTGGKLWAWGANSDGQIGDGTRTIRRRPVELDLTGFEQQVVTPTFTPAEGIYTSPGEIVLECATPGALIYYTTDGTEPTEDGPAVSSGGTVYLDRSTTLKARAWAPDLVPSNVAVATYEFKVADPIMNPPGGLFTEGQTVVLTSDTPDAEIRYTTDGAKPTADSSLYQGPLPIQTFTVLQARGFRDGWTASEVTGATYTFNFGVLNQPVLDPPGGTYDSSVTVALTADAGAEIRYTLDGSDPSLDSDLYGAPILLEQTTVIKAAAFHIDWTASPFASAAYEIQVEAPSFTPAGGTYLNPLEVAITTGTPGATVYYTTDGTDPDDSSTELPPGSTVAVDQSLMLKARAFKPGLTPSDMASAEYSFDVAVVAAVVAGGAHSIALDPDGNVWTWGANDVGQLGDGTVQPRIWPGLVNGIPEVKAIGTGDRHSLAVTLDGRVWAWGENRDGQLGDGSVEPRTFPVLVSDLADVLAVAAGSNHSLALTADQTVWGWGSNDDGQLGDDEDYGPKLKPVQIEGLTEVTAIAAGGVFSAALDGDGMAWVWGDGEAFPEPVLDQVTAMASGDGHILFVRSDNTVWAWGENDSGQLGDGTTETRWYPDQVVSACDGGGEGEGGEGEGEYFDCTPLEGATATAGGSLHSLALLTNGEVYAWGDNASGQLGNGTNDPSLTATPVNELRNIVQVSAGAFHNLAINEDGEVFAWGSNADGQLGDGTTDDRNIPIPIADARFDWRVATPMLNPPAGIYHTDLNVSATSATPGVTIYYTLDESEPTQDSDPWPAAGTLFLDSSSVVKATAFLGDRASRTNTAVYTLVVQDPVIAPPGGDFDAPLNVTITLETPEAAIHYTLDGSQPTEADPIVASGGSIPISHDTTLRARAFKDGWSPGESQATFRIRVIRPTFDPPAGAYDEELDVAITTTTVGATVHYTTDGTNPGPGSPVVEPGETVRVDQSMTLKAWAFRDDLPASDLASGSYELQVKAPVMYPEGGAYDQPQRVWVASPTPGAVVRYTTDGSYPVDDSPIAKAPILIDTSKTLAARAFRAGWQSSDLSSAAYDIGIGQVVAPVFSPPPGHYATARQVTVDCPTDGSVMRYTTNGVDPTETDAELSCGDIINVDATTVLKAKAWKDGLQESLVRSGYYTVTGAVSSGSEFTLLLKADGTVWSWGRNDGGQLGDGTMEQRSQPVAVEGLPDIVAISAGGTHALALDADGSVWAWGNNADGQLGTGSAGGLSTVPVRVSVLSNVSAISAGTNHNLALTSNGTVWAWGDNSNDQVGIASDPQPTPVTVDTYGLGPTEVIAAGSFHSFAIRRYTRTLKSWGYNAYGQLGHDSGGAPVGSPRLVPLSDVGMVAGGWQHSVAIRDSGAGVGEVWEWGGGYGGSMHEPVRLSELDRTVALSAGREHRLALDEVGQLWAWGDNGAGQLGLGFTDGIWSKPLPVADGGEVVQLSAGALHSAAIKADGSVWTWGRNNRGQLGDGTLDSRPMPQPIDGLSAAANTWLHDDPDGDGLTSAREQMLGCNPFIADTNEDGLADGLAIDLGLSCSHPDVDGDGLFNAEEIRLGTDPFLADTDGDGAGDAIDCYPLDPSRFECEPGDPDDVEPPIITIIIPPGAVLVSSNP